MSSRVRNCAIVAEAVSPDEIEIRVFAAAVLIARITCTPREISRLVAHLQLTVAQTTGARLRRR